LINFYDYRLLVKLSKFKYLKMSITQTKKLNRADFMFQNKEGEELIKKPGDINGIDFKIQNLTDC